MRTKLETAHDASSIGTFVLTIVIVALMVIPMLWPSDASPQHGIAVPGGQRMIGWLMPSILAFCLVLAGLLHFLAARTRHEPSSPARTESLEKVPALVSPRTVSAHTSEKRIFVGPEITPQFLFSLLSGRTEVQAERLLDIYVGKWIKLSGDVSDVGKFEYGSSTVMFSSQPLNGIPVVVMNFGEAWTEQLSVLRPGNNINVIGRIKSVNTIRVKLEDCELV